MLSRCVTFGIFSESQDLPPSSWKEWFNSEKTAIQYGILPPPHSSPPLPLLCFPALCQLWREAPLCLLQVVLPVVRNFLSHLAPDQQVDPDSEAVAGKDAHSSSIPSTTTSFLEPATSSVASRDHFLIRVPVRFNLFPIAGRGDKSRGPLPSFLSNYYVWCSSTYNGATSHSIYHCRFADWKCHK